jgi:hypothetical protein
MKNYFARAFRFLRAFFKGVDQAHRDKMVALTNYEARELENMFVLLLIGSFAGMPSPPSFLAVEFDAFSGARDPRSQPPRRECVRRTR